MSVSVELADLQERLSEYGPIAFLITVGDTGSPHVVSVRVGWQDGHLVVGAGRTTAANATANPAVTAVWPAIGGGDYCLIVDGTGRIEGADDERQLRIEPVRAVLHRVASAGTDGPSCVTVLDQRGAAGR